MNKHEEEIISLVRNQPGLRAVQISDKLDIDLDIVENILVTATRHGKLLASKITAPNGLQVDAFRANPTVLGWVAAATPGDKVKDQEQSSVKPVKPEAAKPPQAKEPTKIDKALAFLEGKKEVTGDDLCRAMGLEPSRYSPTQYISRLIQDGTVIKRGKWYCLASEADDLAAPDTTAQKAVLLTKQEHDPVYTPQHYTAGGIEFIDILRAKLTPEELRGYFKGNVIKYVIRAELKDGPQDYQKCARYANWLAQAETPVTQ
ncbi:MAG: DUF3310 domain-containing protein [Undibacterium umbellatum]|uniref:DUF3310 domain-containing protein n=1 Tax=Undibacterium umbellatum TaxID=2762300 RepID=UPI003BB61A64